MVSRRTILTNPSSCGSVLTSKTYIESLEKQLKQEKDAREQLAKEIEEIKRINTEITSKLGISTTIGR